MERLLEEISFEATELSAKHAGEVLKIDANYVDNSLGELAQDEDLSRYIL